jgi:ligand-binding sensor domain-containing protein/putative methionine-R-sulfoxide reductase with GAF domain
MKKPLLITLFFFLGLYDLQAQLLFTTLKPSDGLSSREVQCVFRDREGYVWVGATNGLNRFDGNHFKVWNKLSTGYPESLGEFVTTIIEHKDGTIWFGTNAGVGLLDKVKSEVTEVAIKNAGVGIKPTITNLAYDGNGRLWVGSTKGVMLERKGRLVPVSDIYPFAKGLDTVVCIHASFVYDSRRDCVWIGTTTGSYCLDIKKQQLFSAENNPGRLPILTKDVVNAIALSDSSIWFSNATKGVLCGYDTRSGSVQKIARINNNPSWNLNGGCNTLFFDDKGRLWISTWLYNSFIRYPDGSIVQIPYHRDRPYSIGYGIFNDAYQDVYGNIWLATINGLSKLTASDFIEDIVQAQSYSYFLDIDFANVNTLETDDAAWWLGKMDGLVRYDLKTKTFAQFVISQSNLRQNEIRSFRWIGGQLWCGTTNGIYLFDPKQKRFSKFTKWPSVLKEGGFVYWIRKDKNGNVWFSVWHEGVFRYDPKTGTCTSFRDNKVQWNALAATVSYAALEDSKGNMWIGTAGTGVGIVDPSLQKVSEPFSPGLRKIGVVSIAEDGQKHIWLSTARNGFIQCDLTGKILDSITRKDGLPSNVFNQLVVDDFGRLWAVSRENLVCIVPGTKEITKVDIPVNFSFNDHWISLAKRGKLLYATMLDNIVVINTEKYHQQLPKEAKPLLSAFRVFGKERPLQKKDTITLNYDQNFFSFDFASPFHREARSMQYAYKLEGFDKEWVYSGRKLTAAYTNVPSGSYTFLVKTIDGKGQWMQSAAKVHIVILPPFWKRWWFIGMLGAFVLLGLLWWVQVNSRRKQKNRLDETINYFANAVYGTNSITEICSDIARNCVSQLKFEDCGVYLLDERRGVLVQKAAFGLKNPKGHEMVNPVEIEVGSGIPGAAAKAGKPVFIGDTAKEKWYVPDSLQQSLELAVPVIHEGTLIGVIHTVHKRKRFFTDNHLKALSTIAAISANKIAEAKAEEIARESTIQLLEIKKLLAESQLMALRAQMNPHFVFNCLNSIQECIVTQKYGEASLYLNKFSKLFRSVLNNSGRALITLDEEINVLELYLELEQMRFGQSFGFTLHLDEELESEEILIPSMLLQPFVENALWHGLMHKDGDRQLFISFTKKSEQVFECIVDDNGIGRKQSLELKERQNKTKRHVSRGMDICKDRIDLLQKQGQHASLVIVDKYNNEGLATGTRVVIELFSFLQ